MPDLQKPLLQNRDRSIQKNFNVYLPMKLRHSICFLIALSGLQSVAHGQQTYRSFRDTEGDKVLVGTINEKILANDSAFTWFYSGVNDYQPDMAWLRDIRAYRDSFQVVVFAGTWCPDSKILLPQFYRVMMAAGYPLDRIRLYAVDHQLRAENGEARTFRLRSTPTFIFLYRGKELGRIVEKVHGSMESDIVGILDRMASPHP